MLSAKNNSSWKYERSAPVPIPSKSKDLDENIEYHLKSNFFNPHKGSPPNTWNERLIQRLGDSYKKGAQFRIFERK